MKTVLLLLIVLVAGQSAERSPSAEEVQRLADANRLAAEAASAYARNDFKAAAELYIRAFDAGATVSSVPYNAACCYARLGHTDDAFKYLDLAVQLGWRDADHLRTDADLELLHADPRWEEIVGRSASRRDEFRRTMTEPDLHDELVRRMKADQVARLAQSPNPLDMMRIDADNTAWMRQVIEKHGWPGHAMVGRDGAQAAWLLVQHADLDHDFQRRCLELLTGAFEKGDATAQSVAYLTDRVLVAEGKPQIYGTQFQTVAGKLRPFPIENEPEVDQRRAKIGLQPLAEYAELLRANERP